MRLDLSDEQLKAILSAAIIEHLGPDNRDKLLRSAIEDHLMKPESSTGYRSDPRTRLQVAFDQASFQVAVEIIREELKKEPSRMELEKLVRATIEKVMSEHIETLATEMAQAFQRAISKDR